MRGENYDSKICWKWVKNFQFSTLGSKITTFKNYLHDNVGGKNGNLKRMQSDFCNLVLLEISLWSCWHKIYFYQQMDRRVFRTCHICITVILKRSKFVRKVKDIRKLTERRLEEWKQNKFDELLNEAHQHTTSHSNIQFTIQALNLSLIYQDRVARPKNNIERGSP